MVIYDGEEIPQYEAEQMQRKMERQIRNDKRMLAGYDEAIKSADDEKLKSKLQEDFDFRALKLKEYEKNIKIFANKLRCHHLMSVCRPEDLTEVSVRKQYIQQRT